MASVYYQPYRQKGLRFSRLELGHILLAIAILTPAFALAIAGGIYSYRLLARIPFALTIAALAVPTGFLLHEMGHKAVAQRYGCWAEFRAFPMGLLIALLTSMVGFFFAAPGAVVISGLVNRQQNGRISLAGPGVNLILGGAFLALALALKGHDVPFLTGSLHDLTYNAYGINALLAAFNLLPFPPLDGSKIWPWNPVVYLALFVVALAFAGVFFLAPFA